MKSNFEEYKSSKFSVAEQVFIRKTCSLTRTKCFYSFGRTNLRAWWSFLRRLFTPGKEFGWMVNACALHTFSHNGKAPDMPSNTSGAHSISNTSLLSVLATTGLFFSFSSFRLENTLSHYFSDFKYLFGFLFPSAIPVLLFHYSFFRPTVNPL